MAQYLTGRPSSVVRQLHQIVQDYADHPKVVEFYLGRATSVEEPQARHGAHEIVGMYETDSADHAIEVEAALIERWLDHPKCSNDAPDGRGGRSEVYRSIVYVALWLRGR